MPVLQIAHQVLDVDAWKDAFDRDPAGRERSGVRRYTIARATDDPTYVTIDLEFDSVDQAQALLATMRGIWQNVQGTRIRHPVARIVDVVERHEYPAHQG